MDYMCQKDTNHSNRYLALASTDCVTSYHVNIYTGFPPTFGLARQLLYSNQTT